MGPKARPMVEFEKHRLANGLRVIAHRDTGTPMVAMNVLYDVGSRDEDPPGSGLAHLFEHMMFEGSLHVPHYDKALQDAGGENNAFTTNDVTNYYLSLPAMNLETAFWLESDRMLGLDITEEKLEVQKNVVMEEFRQSTLNQPYGDVWLLLRPLCYQLHPYRWDTIGQDPDHIARISLQQAQAFFTRHYHPGNAILCVAGQVDPERVFALAEKWFGDIPSVAEAPSRALPREADQGNRRFLEVKRPVPSDQLYMAFLMGERNHPDFYTADLLSDVLGSGPSARLTQRLVKKKKIFVEADAYLTGSLDPGLFVVTATLRPGVSLQEAEKALWDELLALGNRPLAPRELQKVKNKLDASQTYSRIHVLAKAMNLAYYELMGDAAMLNRQGELYAAQTAACLQEWAAALFRRDGAHVLYYRSQDE